MRVGRVVDAVGVEAGEHVEGEGRGGFHVDFAGQADAVAERSQVVGQAGGFGAAGGVVPGAAVAQRVLAGIEFRPAGLAHRLAEVGLVEGQALAGEAVDIGGLRIGTAVERQVVVGAVIGDDDEEVRRLPGGSGGGAEAGNEKDEGSELGEAW